MNRLLLLLFAVCAGAIGFGALERNAQQTRGTICKREEIWQVTTNSLAEAEQLSTALRAEVESKRNRLQDVGRHRNISPELVRLLLDREASKGHAAASAELRQELGVGWDSSPDYVLVNKRVLKDLDFQWIVSAKVASDTACDLLALSPAEQAAMGAALQHAREQGQALQLERHEPSGDAVAQYTALAMDAGVEQSLSNTFAAEVSGILDPERAALFFPAAWQELRNTLAPREMETLTIRRTVVNGEPDLVFELKRGTHMSTAPVRYGHYPSQWFDSLFSGGWKTLAEREGFDLPQMFQPSGK